MNILQSPDIVLEHILSYLSFDEISKMRLVNMYLYIFNDYYTHTKHKLLPDISFH